VEPREQIKAKLQDMIAKRRARSPAGSTVVTSSGPPSPEKKKARQVDDESDDAGDGEDWEDAGDGAMESPKVWF